MSPFREDSFYGRQCKSKLIQYDEACLEVFSDRPFSLWTQYTACWGCDKVKTLEARVSDSVKLSTVYPVNYSVKDASQNEICNGTFSFGEYGKYRLNVTASGCDEVIVVDPPDEPLFPALAAIVVLLSVATFWYIVKGLHRWFMRRQFWASIVSRFSGDSELLIGTPTDATHNRVNSRLRSLDVFRGITIALMIFVNYGGGGYAIMKHTPWNGISIADVVFPWFAWLMGFSLCLSLHTRLRTSMKRRTALFQILRRSATLIILGIILSSKNRTIGELRLPGVLQRLGLAYLLNGALECAYIDPSNNYISGIFRDLRSTLWQWSGTFLFVGAHTLLTFLLRVPGCPTGYLGPGGLHNHSSYPNCTGGAAGYIDEVVLGESHLYKAGTFRALYHSESPFDPEGLLGTLTCALVVQLGAQAARVLLAYSVIRARMARWILWGTLCVLIACGLCTFSVNNGPIPINKNLWSLSYCLVTAGMAFFILAFLYLIIDAYPVWQGRPFYYAGRNALLLYIGHELMKGRFPFEWKLENPSHMELLAMNSFAVLLWLMIAIILHRKNVILTI